MSAAPQQPLPKLNGAAVTHKSVRDRLKQTRMNQSAMTEEELQEKSKEANRIGFGASEDVTHEQVLAALKKRRERASDTGRKTKA